MSGGKQLIVLENFTVAVWTVATQLSHTRTDKLIVFHCMHKEFGNTHCNKHDYGHTTDEKIFCLSQYAQRT